MSTKERVAAKDNCPLAPARVCKQGVLGMAGIRAHPYPARCAPVASWVGCLLPGSRGTRMGEAI